MGFKTLTAAGAIKEGPATGVDLGAATGTLDVAHGGTGATTLTGVLRGTGTSAFGVTAIPSDATKFLNGAATPAYALVKDSDLSTSDVTTNDVSITKHGFAPKAPNDATKYLDGTGSYSVPPGSSSGSLVTASFNITAAQINSGNTTPIELVAAPGAGKIVVPLGIWIHFRVTTPFTAAASMQFRWGSGTLELFTDYAASLTANGYKNYWGNATLANVNAADIFSNQNYVILMSSDNTTGVISESIGYITYVIATLP